MINFESFLVGISDLSYLEMIKEAELKCKLLENTKNRDLITQNYDIAEKIKNFLFWLRTGEKPYSLDKKTFLLIKPICKNLIDKGQLKNEAIEIFK